jgi:hypothetical protein
MQNASMNGQPLPPFPGFAYPPQPFHAQTPQLPATPMPFPPQPSQPAQPTLPASDRIQEVMESDREDGEVSEGEVASQAPARHVNGPAYPEPPRSVPHAAQPSPREEETYNPDQPAAGQIGIKEPVRKASQKAVIEKPVDVLQQYREQAKQFIKLLHSNNIGYRTMAKEPLDLEQLRGIYQSLNLPSEPAPIVPVKAAAVEAPEVPVQTSVASAVHPLPSGPAQQKPAPTVKTNVNPVPPTSSAPSPVDRRDYIARLQAAKLAKQSGAPKASPPRNTPPVTVAPPALPVKAITPTAKPPVTDEQRARNTELIKQRLEVIKAKKLAPTVNGTASAPSQAQKVDTVSSAAEQAAQPALSGNTTPNNQSYVPPFPGLPGLFMNPPPSYDNGASRSTHSIPLKRPAPSESTEVSTPRGSVTPYTRPLGDSPHTYHEESMIIEVSDDDDSNGSDMDIDDDQAASKSGVASPPSNLRYPPGTLPDFPSRPASVLHGSSAVSTPGPQTPATQAREKELKKKEDELAAMRMTLKKKLAEKREKDKAAAAAAAISSPASHGLPAASTLPPPVPGSIHSTRIEHDSASNDVSNDANELIRDVKRRRRDEIRSKLPSFDAELAMNTNKMAQLMKEMELLRAQNEKITEDRERLTKELEGLGVDTEGMSHAEMRAIRDEIDEQEKSPEPEHTTHSENVDLTNQSKGLEDSSTVPAIEADQEVVEVEDVPETVVSPVQNEVADQRTFLPGLTHRPQQQLNDETVHPHVSMEENQEPLAEAKGSATSFNAVTVPEVQDFTTPLDEEEDFYSPAPAVQPVSDKILDLEHEVQAHSDVHTADDRSPSEEGEVEMSLSSEDEEEEEEYEPEEPIAIADVPAQGAQVPEVETTKSVESNHFPTEDEEAYEPPDVDEEMSDVQTDSKLANGDATALEVEADDGAMDIASSSSEDSDSDSESDGEITSDTGNEAISASHMFQQNTNFVDDLAPELQPEAAPEPVRLPLATKPS